MFDWSLYFDTAHALMALQTDAGYRSAISRAYYAAYNQVRVRYGEERAHVMADPNSNHIKMWRYFKDDGSRYAGPIGELGERLRQTRNNADYDVTFDGIEKLPQLAEGAIEDALEILENLKLFIKQYPRK